MFWGMLCRRSNKTSFYRKERSVFCLENFLRAHITIRYRHGKLLTTRLNRNIKVIYFECSYRLYPKGLIIKLNKLGTEIDRKMKQVISLNCKPYKSDTEVSKLVTNVAERWRMSSVFWKKRMKSCSKCFFYTRVSWVKLHS